MTVRAMI